MAPSSAGEVCRLLVIGPTSRVDLSVPTHVPLTDLMPAMLRSLGPDLADRGLEHSGWVLQRLGSAPLDEDRSVAEHGLLDGDTVHVRPRSDQIPPLDFDDLIDGVSTGISARSGLWRSRTTRTVSVLALTLWLMVALLVPLFAGRPVVVDGHAAGGTVSRATCVGVAAVVLYGAVWAASRLAADRVLAAVAGVGVVAFAAAAAALAVADAGGGPGSRSPSRLPSMLLAGAGVAVLAVLVVLMVAAVRETLLPVGLAVVVAALGVIVAGGLSSAAGLDWTRVAAVMSLLCVAARPAVPTSSFKLAGLALPPLPVEPADLQKDIEPESGVDLLARTARADRYMTAVYAACGALSSLALVRLALAPGWMPPTLALLVGVAQVLASRPMTSTWHRLALGLPAIAGGVTVVLSLAARSRGPAVAMLLALLLAAVAGGCAHVLPRRRLTPIWGRLGDWGHTLALVVSVPLVVCLLGAVGHIRSVVG